MKKLLVILTIAILGFGFAVAQKRGFLANVTGDLAKPATQTATTRQLPKQSVVVTAACEQGTIRKCSLKGKPEQQVCDDGVWTSCGTTKYFLTIEGLDSHPIEMEINGFSLGPKNTTGATKETGRVPHFSDLHCTKLHDVASPKLLLAIAKERKVRVELRADVNDDLGHLLSRWQYWFSDATVSNYQQSGAIETISFNFANMYKGPLKEN